jgi:hypothetical protein
MIKPIHIFLTFFFVMFLYAIVLQSNRNQYLYQQVNTLQKEVAVLKQILNLYNE